MNSFSFCRSESIFVLPLFLEHFAGYRTLVDFSLHVLSCCSSVFRWLCLLWDVCQRPHVPPHACPQHTYSADRQSLRAGGRPRQCTLAVSVSVAVCVVSGFVSVDWFLSLHFQTFLYLVVFCCMPDIVPLPLWVLGIFVFLSTVWFFLFLKFISGCPESLLLCADFLWPCPGFSLQWLLLLPRTGSGVWAQQLWLTAPVPRGLRNLLHQGSNLHPLPWHVGP